jgi:PDDEXK-like domain of unknown function (DUF3799)
MKTEIKARVLDVTPEQYHTDPCLTPSLSSSIAKIIIERSPAHARLAHPRLGGASKHSFTESMSNGSVIHRMVLGKGSSFDTLEFPDYRTKAAQQARDASRAQGRTPMLAHEVAELVDAAKHISAQLAAYGFDMDPARSEVAAEWQERVHASDALVQCRCMFDHVYLEDGLILDLKTTVSANPVDLQRAITRYGYDVQHAAYTSALRTLRPRLAGREEFVFLFVEIEEPYAVTPVKLTGEFRALGQSRWSRAVRTWYDCLTNDDWPAYTRGVVEIEPTPWALAAGM